MPDTNGLTELGFLLKVRGILNDEDGSQLLDILALAREYDFQGEKETSMEVHDLVMSMEGYFTTQEIYTALNVKTKEGKSNVRKALSRMKECNLIEPPGKRAGQYRRIISDCDKVDWANAPVEPMDIVWPFELESLVEIYPSNVIIVAGDTNAGKTTFLLDFVRMNMKNHKIHLFNSEMGSSEFKLRLSLFDTVELGEWNFTAWERSDEFHDVIKPDDINIIDFLEVTNEFWKVGRAISDIHSKLKKGIAVIAIQKNRGTDLGRGGSFGAEKPRLYMAMERGRIKMVKAKNWKTHDNPNGLVQDFKLVRGWKFIPEGGWHWPTETDDKLERYE